MEITTPVSVLLDQKFGPVWTIGPQQTVFEAISLMAEKNIGALPVVADETLLGLISERDYTRKVILHGRVSRETLVEDIMVISPTTVESSASVERSMQLMTEHHIRHLPVLKEGRMIGLLSMGDVVNWTIASQKSAIRDLTNFVTGSYPG